MDATLPSGDLLIENSIKGFDFGNIDEIVVIAKNEHISKYNFSEKYLLNSLEKSLIPKPIFF